jgi:hypothetical protein
MDHCARDFFADKKRRAVELLSRMADRFGDAKAKWQPILLVVAQAICVCGPINHSSLLCGTFFPFDQ